MLTDTKCKNAKHVAKPYKLSDGGGLYLFVTPTGKLWNMAYRFNGKQKKLSFGAYPAVSLADARGLRDLAKVRLSAGSDPGETKKEAKRAKLAERTFGDWADEWIAKERLLWDERTIDGKERYVSYLAGPAEGNPTKRIKQFGRLTVPGITRSSVIAFLATFEKEGTLETRDRVRSTGEQICTYADVDGTDYNPFRNLKKQLVAKETEHRPALTKITEVVDLFQNIAAPYQGARYDDLVGHALRFHSLTAVRPGETINAEWDEIDLETMHWTVPATKMKMRHEHVVPLSRQALAILAEVKKITGDRRFVFSCSRDEPISGDTLCGRLRRLGYDTAVQHCAHGFRTTFSTLCNRETDREENKLWHSDVIELQLAHLNESSVKAIYNRTGPLSLIGARAKLLQHWADRIDTMVGNNVVPLGKRA